MIYRRISPTGDYTFGQGQLDYCSGREAVAQAIRTRLKLLYTEWWEDLDDGLPLFQVILLQRDTSEGLQTVDLLIRERVLSTEQVTGISAFASKIEDGQYKAWLTVDTTYGQVNTSTALEVGR